MNEASRSNVSRQSAAFRAVEEPWKKTAKMQVMAKAALHRTWDNSGRSQLPERKDKPVYIFD